MEQKRNQMDLMMKMSNSKKAKTLLQMMERR